jgi:signal transduction histidine kinase
MKWWRALSRRAGRKRPHGSGWPLLGLFLVVLMLVLNVSLALMYRQVRGTIEVELGQRLLGIATATAAGIDEDDFRALLEDPGDEAPAREQRRLQARLRLILYETDLGEIYVLSDEFEYLLDAAGHHPRGYAHPAVDLHFGAVTAAMTGVAAASDLYRAGQVYLKTAFAPVFGLEGEVLGAVGIEGGSHFFAGLWQVRRQVLFSGMIGVAVVLALALFFGRILRTQARAERTLRETATLAAAGELAAILAHEIRNPLAIISSRAERVRAKIHQGKSSEELLAWFEAIPREIERLNRVLGQYLTFARPAEPEGEAADFDGTLDAVLTLLEGDFRRKGVSVRRGGPTAEPLRVRMAPAALHQILLNLLLNARDAMPHGGTVSVSASASVDRVIVTVSDTGCGMSPAQQRKAFDSFYTTKEHGSGLGLAVVRSMLELYGGAVELESRPGVGTTFTLSIERHRGQSEPG